MKAKTVVLYQTLIEGTQYWKKFDDPDDAYNFVHKRSFLNVVSSYQVYRRLDASEQIYPIKLQKEPTTRKFKNNKFLQAKKDVNKPKIIDHPKAEKESKLKAKSLTKDSKEKSAVSKKEPPVPPIKIKDSTTKATLNDKQEFPYKSGSVRNGNRTSKSGKSYRFSEEYGTLEENNTRTTDRYEIDYMFNKNSDPRPSFIKSESNLKAINIAKGIVETAPSVILHVYNLDKKGTKSNLLYSYEFKGLIK